MLMRVPLLVLRRLVRLVRLRLPLLLLNLVLLRRLVLLRLVLLGPVPFPLPLARCKFRRCPR